MLLNGLKFLIVSAFFFSLLVDPVARASEEPVTNETPSTGFFSSMVYSLSLGALRAKAGDTQTFYTQPAIERAYVANQQSDILPKADLFVGIRKELSSTLHGRFGLGLGVSGNADLSGVIWDDADPAFDNYSYDYQVQHTQLGVEGKIFMSTDFFALMPYLGLRLALGINRAHDYKSTPTVSGAVSAPNFSTNSTTVFTYTVSLGVQRALDEHWQVGLGYEFSDWGKSQLGTAPGQTMGSGLAMSHLYTHGLLVNIAYLN